MIAPYRWRYRLLLGLIVVQLSVFALEFPSPWTDVSDIVFAPLFGALLLVIRQDWREAALLVVLALIAPTLNLLVPWNAAPALDVAKVVFWTLPPAYLAWKIFLTVYEVESVTSDEILAAVAVYLLLGLVFTNIYEALFLIDPQGLEFSGPFDASDFGFAEVLYFSFVTLATLGYGDISPVHPLMRLVAVVESIVGVMYVAILISRFVGIHLREPR